MDDRYRAALAAKRLRPMAGLQEALDPGTGLAHPIAIPDAPCPWANKKAQRDQAMQASKTTRHPGHRSTSAINCSGQS
jgi:hypothetical protein